MEITGLDEGFSTINHLSGVSGLKVKEAMKPLAGVENRLQVVETQSGQLIEFHKGQNLQGLANILTQRIQAV